MSLTEQEVREWRGRIQIARLYQSKHGDTALRGGKGRWSTYVKALAGDFDSISDLGEEAIDVNMVHATTKTTLPPLWLTEPHVTFRPTRATIEIGGQQVDNVRRAEFAEAEINYWMSELKIRELVTRPCVIDAEATNHAYAYLGYISEKIEVESTQGETTEPEPTVRFKQPFVKRWPVRQVLIPPGYWYIELAPWICMILLKPLKDVQDRYENTEDLKATKSLLPDADEKTVSADMREFVDSEDAKRVELQVVWDKRSKMIYTFADGHDQVLKEEKWELEMEGFPVVDLSFVDVPDEYYGSPSIQFYYPQNKELNAARTAMRKRFNRSKGIVWAAGEVGDEVKEAYEKAQDSTIISTGLTTDEFPIDRLIKTDPGLTPDTNVLVYEQRIMSDILQTSGQGAEQRGAADPNVRTATTSANIEKHVQIRASDKGDRVRTFYLAIARKLWMILQQFPDIERDRLVAGSMAGQFKRLRYSLKELKGEFALEMDLSTVLAENPATRLQTALANYNLLRGDPLVNPEKLILDVMQAENKPNPEQYLLFLRSPDEEFQLMLQGLPVEPHDRDEHESHLAQHDAQGDQIEAELLRVDPTSGMGRKLRFTLGLLLAHQNAHMRILQSIVQPAGRQPGQPIAENMLRSQQTAISGRETAAELGGQPLATTPGGATIGR